MIEAMYVQAALTALFWFAVATAMAVAVVIVRFYLTNGHLKLKNSCLYIGRVKHSRLKGGAMHQLDYPLFFSYIDLEEVQSIGWSLWPIFKHNGGWSAFCSLDDTEHLKGFQEAETPRIPLKERVKSFVSEKTGGKMKSEGPIMLMTHLTYFGYCFNPVSFYFIQDKVAPQTAAKTAPLSDTIIAEVSNTPWIEQHSYVLNENVEAVEVHRKVEKNANSAEKEEIFEATWRKEFHVSPFMEMDYKYTFKFSVPGETVNVSAKMLKLSTNELWFIAQFNLQRIAFTPLNLLYVLVFYPLHTRVIQVLIHWEALKIVLKGVPFFDHPNGTDVNFGFGITDRKIKEMFEMVFFPLIWLYGVVRGWSTSGSAGVTPVPAAEVKAGRRKAD